MIKMKKEYKIILIVGLFYLVYILLFLAKFDFNPSATIELSERHAYKFNGTLPSGLVVQKDSDGYDGQFYYMMAVKPLLGHVMVNKIILQRIGYPLSGHIFAFGNINLIPWTLILINYASMILSTYFVVLLLKRYNANLNLAYLWAFNMGLLITTIRDLPEPLMFLFVIIALYFLEHKKIGLASIFFSISFLSKESAIFVIMPILMFYLVKKEAPGLSKGEFCQRIGARILVDDFIGNLEDCGRLGISAYLFGNWPFSRFEHDSALREKYHFVQRARDWSELVEKLMA